MQLLSEARLLERRIFGRNATLLDEATKASFPPLPEMEQAILEMECAAVDCSYTTFVTPYVRIYEGGWFLDVYYKYRNRNVYSDFNPERDKQDDENGSIKRIIIAPNCLLSEEDECFLNEIDHTIFLVEENERVTNTAELIKELKTLAPEINMGEYEKTIDVLLHAYFASHRSGVKELLYKCGLHEIAKNLSVISGYNIVGTNLQEAFDIQVGLLKKLNHFECLEVLYDEHTRLMAKRVYREHHNALRGFKNVNLYMLMYLDSIGRSKPDKVVLESLATLESGVNDAGEFIEGIDIYKQYMDYLNFREGFGKNHKHFPKFVNLDIESSKRYMTLFDLSKQYKEEGISEIVEKRHKEWTKFAYENDEYKVIIPRSMQEFLDESQQQDNCLFTMVDEILRGDCTVLFMRSKKNLSKSLVTFEVRRDSIVQAKRRFNKAIEPKDKEFLQEFARVKNLVPSCLEEVVNGQMGVINLDALEPVLREFRAIGTIREPEDFMSIPEVIHEDGLPFA